MSSSCSITCNESFFPFITIMFQHCFTQPGMSSTENTVGSIWRHNLADNRERLSIYDPCHHRRRGRRRHCIAFVHSNKQLMLARYKEFASKELPAKEPFCGKYLTLLEKITNSHQLVIAREEKTIFHPNNRHESHRTKNILSSSLYEALCYRRPSYRNPASFWGYGSMTGSHVTYTAAELHQLGNRSKLGI